MRDEKFLGDKSHGGTEPPVSVILTVVNEAAHLEESISAVLNSQYSGAIEIAISVGPSRDKTREIADSLAQRESRVKVIDNPSGRTPDGLNSAIAATSNEIIVRVDGHSSIRPDYIREAVLTLNQTGAVNVGGVMAAEGITPFQRAVARAMRSPIGVGASRFHTGGSAGSVDTVYLGVFKRSALIGVGGYDSRFTRAQDWELNYRLRERGGVIWFNPKLTVTYRPRSTFKSLAKQYFEYGRWRAAVSRHHKGTTNFRYLAPPLNIFFQALSILLGTCVAPVFFIPTFFYFGAILISSLVIGKSWAERIRLPFVLTIMHFSWGIGFITSPRTLISNS